MGSKMAIPMLGLFAILLFITSGMAARDLKEGDFVKEANQVGPGWGRPPRWPRPFPPGWPRPYPGVNYPPYGFPPYVWRPPFYGGGPFPGVGGGIFPGVGGGVFPGVGGGGVFPGVGGGGVFPGVGGGGILGVGRGGLP